MGNSHRSFENIWLVGGAMLCQRFLELGLVDEIRVDYCAYPAG